jgi:hypothetical protein
MAPLHLPTNTDQAHPHNRNAQGNTTSRPPPLPHVGWVSRCDSSKKGTAPMTSSPHVHRGLGFLLGNPCYKDMVPPQWCPQQGERRPKGAATNATESGGFRPEHHSGRILSTKRQRPAAPQPRHLHREKPNTARGTTTTPSACTYQPPTPPPDQRRISFMIELGHKTLIFIGQLLPLFQEITANLNTNKH